MICEDTLDDRIWKTVQRKLDVVGQALNQAKAKASKGHQNASTSPAATNTTRTAHVATQPIDRFFIRKSDSGDSSNPASATKRKREDNEGRDSGASPCALAVGTRVLIDGLISRPELNQKEGVIREIVKETGRYAVNVAGQLLALRPECLTPARPKSSAHPGSPAADAGPG